MQIYPDKLGPAAVRTVARMTLSAELYSALEGDGALGIRGKNKETRWDTMMEHLRERLGCTRMNIKMGLARLRQEGLTMKEFAREFERRAVDAELQEEDAKLALISALDTAVLDKMDTYIVARDPSAALSRETANERLSRVSYAAMISFLKQTNLVDVQTSGAGGTMLKNSSKTTANLVEPGQQEPTMSEDIPPAFAPASGFRAAGIFVTAPGVPSPSNPPHL